MGKTSNFATVPARLIVDGTDHGIQMFLVQLRDLETHQPLPGKGSLSVAVGKQKKKKMQNADTHVHSTGPPNSWRNEPEEDFSFSTVL